jgi:hypothetical protein
MSSLLRRGYLGLDDIISRVGRVLNVGGSAMHAIVIWCDGHRHLTILMGAGSLTIGLLLIFAPRRPPRASLTATQRGVAVGRDNYGTIMTGDMRNERTPENGRLLDRIASWASIFGLLLAILGIILTLLTWLHPEPM